MLSSFLMGLVGGQRSMTPLAAVALAATADRLPRENGGPPLLSHPIVASGAVLLAVAELAGDKQRTAPDRTVAIGVTARFITSAIAGASLAPRRHRWVGAAIGGTTAAIASYPGWRMRMAAMRRGSQVSTGLAEDAIMLASAAAIIFGQKRNAGDHRFTR